MTWDMSGGASGQVVPENAKLPSRFPSRWACTFGCDTISSSCRQKHLKCQEVAIILNKTRRWSGGVFTWIVVRVVVVELKVEVFERARAAHGISQVGREIVDARRAHSPKQTDTLTVLGRLQPLVGLLVAVYGEAGAWLGMNTVCFLQVDAFVAFRALCDENSTSQFVPLSYGSNSMWFTVKQPVVNVISVVCQKQGLVLDEQRVKIDATGVFDSEKIVSILSKCAAWCPKRTESRTWRSSTRWCCC